MHGALADKPEYYWYECVVLVEKLLLAGLLIFAGQGTVFQAFGGVAVAFVFAVAQAQYWP